MRHPAHRHSLSLRQRQVEQTRALLGIAEEKLIEVAQPEQQHGIGWNFAFQPVILLHHRRKDIGHGAPSTLATFPSVEQNFFNFGQFCWNKTDILSIPTTQRSFLFRYL